MSPFFLPTAQGYLLRLTVVPGAQRTQVVGLYGDRLKVRLAAPPGKRLSQPGTYRLFGPIPQPPQEFLQAHRRRPEPLQGGGGGRPVPGFARPPLSSGACLQRICLILPLTLRNHP